MRAMKKLIIIVLAFLIVETFHETSLQAQDLEHYKQVVKELSSAKYQGRGYAYGGANKAGKYLKKEFTKAGVDDVTCQPFTIDINTFPSKMEMSVDGRELTPGVDFSMREYSPGVKGTYKLYFVDTANYDAKKMFADLAKPEYKDCFVVCDFWFSYKHYKDFQRLWGGTSCANAGLIQTWEPLLKFYKAYGEKVTGKPVIWVTTDFPKDAKSITVNIENKFLKDYELFNVIAKVEGRKHDSCYVFTAHYDHLGNLGKKVFYAGANDNASGTAAIVTLAKYYAQNRPEYDMYFIAFSGEDANLRGSEYYAEHPLVPLTQIKYLFNIDMIGDNNPVQYCEVSDEGMRGYALFEKLNDGKHYFKSLNRGELAGNSDHYPFAVRHVPCIFFENEEGDAFKYYHTTFDTYENFLIDTYEPIFKLVRDFVERY
jgi:Predicted aminopeptidases